jgi:hypothetical protein
MPKDAVQNGNQTPIPHSFPLAFSIHPRFCHSPHFGVLLAFSLANPPPQYPPLSFHVQIQPSLLLLHYPGWHKVMKNGTVSALILLILIFRNGPLK